MTSTETDVRNVNLPAPGIYTVDAVHSSIGFVARHLVAAKVRGNFTQFAGTITIGETLETTSVEATVEAASITTNNEMRDNHVRSADFLDLENHPQFTLKSTRLIAKGGNDFELVADLTIRGITKSVTFDLEYLGTNPGMAAGVTVVGFEATATVDRRDFDVKWDAALENGSLVVGNRVTLELSVEASKQD
ncbi:MAG: YceI family protein [Acidimicrobiales bacterium]